MTRGGAAATPCYGGPPWPAVAARGFPASQAQVLGSETGPLHGPPPADLVLARVIEREVIPRLYMASCSVPAAPAPRPSPAVAAAVAGGEAFVQLVLTEPPHRIVAEVEQLLADGVTLSAIYLDVLTPAARRLGDMWTADECSFVDVALGMSRLHEVLREVGHRHGGPGRTQRARRIHLVPVPGEVHTFGLSVVEEFFVHAGWDTSIDPTASTSSIIEVLESQRIDVLGISISGEERYESLVDLLPAVRKASRNRDIRIMVGGNLLQSNPALTGQLRGVTLIADAVEALRVAEQFAPAAARTHPHAGG